MHWSSLDGTYSEGDPSGDRGQIFDTFRSIRRLLQTKDEEPYRRTGQRNNYFDQWYGMVTQYNVRSLAYSVDVLQALHGLANAMARMHMCTFMYVRRSLPAEPSGPKFARGRNT